MELQTGHQASAELALPTRGQHILIAGQVVWRKQTDQRMVVMGCGVGWEWEDQYLLSPCVWHCVSLALQTALLVGTTTPNFEDLVAENQVKWHDLFRVPIVDFLSGPTITPCRAESQAGPLQLRGPQL